MKCFQGSSLLEEMHVLSWSCAWLLSAVYLAPIVLGGDSGGRTGRLLNQVIGPVTRQEGRYPVITYKLSGVEIAKTYIRTQLSVEETLQLIINAIDTEDYRVITKFIRAQGKGKTLAVSIKDHGPADPPKQRIIITQDSARLTYAKHFCTGIIKSLKKGLSRLKFNGTPEEFLKDYDLAYPSPIWSVTKWELTLFNDPSIFWQFYDFIRHVADGDNPPPNQSQQPGTIPPAPISSSQSVSESEYGEDECSLSVNYSAISETHSLASADEGWLFVSFQDEDHFDPYYYDL